MRSLRYVVAALAVAMAAFAIAACGGSEDGGGSGGSDETAPSGPLVLGEWGGIYNEVTQEVLGEPFAADGGTQLEMVDAPGTQVARLQAQQRSGNIEWDAVDSLPADQAFRAYHESLLEPLPDDLKEKFTETLGEGKVSDFGFTWGNAGRVIVCNMDMVETCPKNVEEFFDVESFPGDRTMAGIGPLYELTLASVANGVDPSETATTPVDLDQAFAALEKIKPHVKVFWESGDQQEQVFRNGEVGLGVIHSGRAEALKSEGMNLEINWDGAVYEPGYWAVVKDAPHKDEAFAFLEWIVDHPEQQAEWARQIHYSVPSPEAMESLSKEESALLVDNPANFDVMALPNFDWYVDNSQDVDSRFQDYLTG